MIKRFKPKSSAKTQLLLSGIMWLVVGVVLYGRAIKWLLTAPYSSTTVFIAIGGATILGLIKGKVVLDRAAKKAIARITSRGDGTCLLGFFSFKSWLLILLMITMGKLLRMSPAPILVISIIYMAIGVALFFASRNFFCTL